MLTKLILTCLVMRNPKNTLKWVTYYQTKAMKLGPLITTLDDQIFFNYSSNKIRKTQNEHLIITCQNLVGL